MPPPYGGRSRHCFPLRGWSEWMMRPTDDWRIPSIPCNFKYWLISLCCTFQITFFTLCTSEAVSQCIVIGPVCLWVFVFVCGSVTMITRNCDPHQTGFAGKGSDHLQLIKFWLFRAPRKGVCDGAKFLALPYYSVQCLRLLRALYSHIFIQSCTFVKFTEWISTSWLLVAACPGWSRYTSLQTHANTIFISFHRQIQYTSASFRYIGIIRDTYSLDVYRHRYSQWSGRFFVGRGGDGDELLSLSCSSVQFRNKARKTLMPHT